MAHFEAGEKAGLLLLDDGSPLVVPAAAVAASGLRLLRAGQRVTIETNAAGEVIRVSLPGID